MLPVQEVCIEFQPFSVDQRERLASKVTQKIRVSRPVIDFLDIHSIEHSGEAVESLLLIGCSRKIAPLHVNTLAPLCVSCVIPCRSSILKFRGIKNGF